MTPDFHPAQLLFAHGYVTLPLLNGDKAPMFSWAEAVRDEQKRVEMGAPLVTPNKDLTGAYLVPRKDDAAKLLILNLDPKPGERFGPWEDLWGQFSGGEDLPDGAAVVSTVSGGCHVWFGLPENFAPAVSGERGNVQFEVFSSGKTKKRGRARFGVVLPGSVVRSKKTGGMGSYDIVEEGGLRPWLKGSSPLPSLPMPPQTVCERMVSSEPSVRDDEGDKAVLPVECRNVLEIWVDPVNKEARSESLFRLGQILGRIRPCEGAVPRVMQRAILDAVKGKAKGHLWEEPDYWQHLARGVRSGTKNHRVSVNPGASKKAPTLSAVEAECRSLWNGVPKAVRYVNSKQQTQFWEVGITHESSEDVKVQVADLSGAALALSQNLGVLSSHAESPIYTSQSWGRLLTEVILRSGAKTVSMGTDLKGAIIKALSAEAMQAGTYGWFTDNPKRPPEPTLDGRSPKKSYLTFTDRDGPESLVLPTQAQEQIVLHHIEMESRGAAWKFLQSCAVPRQSNQFRTKALAFAIRDLTDVAQKAVAESFNQWLVKDALNAQSAGSESA